jgi:hypothetical protein
MAAEKNVVPMVDDKALEGVKWADEKSVNRFFANLGSQKTDKGVWAMIAMGHYKMGLSAKVTSNAMPTAKAGIAAFAEARKTAPGTKGPLSDKTLPTYESVGNSLIKVGYTLPYDGTVIMDFVANKMGSVAFGTRARIIDDIVAKHPTEKEAPTPEQLEAFLPKKAKGNLTDAADAMKKTFDGWETDEGFSNLIGSDETLDDAAQNLKAALLDFIEASNNVVPRTPANTRGKKLGPNALALQAKREARAAGTMQ